MGHARYADESHRYARREDWDCLMWAWDSLPEVRAKWGGPGPWRQSAGGEARFALVPLVLSQQVFVFLRSLAKVGYYAGSSEALTRVPPPEYSYVPAPAVDLPLSVDRGPDEIAIDHPPRAV